jgi:hypothetical protein
MGEGITEQCKRRWKTFSSQEYFMSYSVTNILLFMYAQ